MIARFPQPQNAPVKAPDPGLALLPEISLQHQEHEESLAWVGWMFQGVRARCPALVFALEDEEAGRPAMIAAWEKFVATRWPQVLAPALIAAWQAAQQDEVAGLMKANRSLDTGLDPEEAHRSARAGSILLRGTQGAKYQGVLGHLRAEVEQEGVDVHLAVVWAAITVVFQLPVVDVFSEYLREEWRTATGRHASHADPQGPLSFAAVAHRTLRHAVFPG